MKVVKKESIRIQVSSGLDRDIFDHHILKRYNALQVHRHRVKIHIANIQRLKEGLIDPGDVSNNGRTNGHVLHTTLCIKNNSILEFGSIKLHEVGFLHLYLINVDRRHNSCTFIVVDQRIPNFDALDGLDRLLREEL